MMISNGLRDPLNAIVGCLYFLSLGCAWCSRLHILEAHRSVVEIMLIKTFGHRVRGLVWIERLRVVDLMVLRNEANCIAQAL
jgi:hypothetical protein